MNEKLNKIYKNDKSKPIHVTEVPSVCIDCKGKNIYHWNSYFSYNIFRCGECGREYKMSKKIG